MNGDNLQILKRTAERWWELTASWLRFPLGLIHDIEKTDLRIVDLIAWQRQIDRFNDEPEWLYRLRVKYAFVNAKDAGTPVGMKRIFKRLQIADETVFNERLQGYDWDMIELSLRYQTYAHYVLLLNVLLNQYGRTCRRWKYRAVLPVDGFKVGIGVIINEQIMVTPRLLPIKTYTKIVISSATITINPDLRVLPNTGDL